METARQFLTQGAITITFPIFQVDAFATRLFAGNPAAVMPMDAFPSDATLQSIAAENNVPETAFLVRDGDDYRIRWFTPTVEVPLCGHATLASAAVVMERLQRGRTHVVFHSASGPLSVRRVGDEYAMDFPARRYARIEPPTGLTAALGVEPVDVFDDAANYTALLSSADEVRHVTPDLDAIARLDRGGVVVTARGDADVDFVSRYFAPAKGIPEDPVTGGAHCMLAPFWAERLGKTELRAFQASRRGGVIVCRVAGDRVELQGACVFYLEGRVELGTRPRQRPEFHDGRCHCGAVRFRIASDFPELTTCDCSICRRKNALMVKVHESRFELLSGEDQLSSYRFHTHTATHYFCRVCGIYPFHRKRVTPDHFGVNVYCLEDFDPAGIPVRATCGANMA